MKKINDTLFLAVVSAAVIMVEFGPMIIGFLANKN